jgi:hypothetical protein
MERDESYRLCRAGRGGRCPARLGLPGGFLASIAGRVSGAQKSHEVVLDAAESLRRTTPGFRVVVAGEGTDLESLRSEVVLRLSPIGTFL